MRETDSVLETERLVLRELVPDDVDWLHPILSDSTVMEFYPAPFTQERTERWIAWASSRYDDGFGLWAVVRRDDGLPLGDCGLTLQTVDGEELLEIGYHLRHDCWGNGYATEAARACRTYAFEVLDADQVVSIVRPDNVRSRAVAAKVHDAERSVTEDDNELVVYSSRRDSPSRKAPPTEGEARLS